MANARFIKKPIKRKPMRESYEDFVIENGVLVEYRGNDSDVVVPNEVKEIDDEVFWGSKSLRSIKMPNVEVIGEKAFVRCESLVSVFMPKVRTIGYGAFLYCRSLAGVYLPNVREIGNIAFERCTSLAIVTIPNVQTIGDDAFKYCKSLEDVVINDGAEVGKSAFAYTPIEYDIGERYGLTERKSRRPLRKAKGIKEADGDMKTYEIIYTVDGTLSKQKVRAASQSEAESLIKERNKGNVVIQSAKEIRGMTEDVDKDVRPSPESGAATGIADMLITAINDEWDTIRTYNSIKTTILDMLERLDELDGVTAGDLQDTVEIIENINNEENNHVGMLQSALALFSENVETIKDGEKEADGIKTEVAEGDIKEDEFVDDEYVGRLVKNVKGVLVDA